MYRTVDEVNIRNDPNRPDLIHQARIREAMSVFQYWLIGGTLAAGLALLGAIIVFGYAWYPDVVREQVGSLLAEGRTLLRIAQLEQDPAPRIAVQEWNQRVTGYLAWAMDKSLAHHLDDNWWAPIPQSTLRSEAHRQLELDLRIAIASLERFLSELGSDGLSAGPELGSRFGQQLR